MIINTNILKKCLLELEKENPDLSYIKGMLETLVDMNDSSGAKAVRDDSYTTSRGMLGGNALVPNRIEDDEMTEEEKAVAEAMGLVQAGFSPKPGVMEQNTVLNP